MRPSMSGLLRYCGTLLLRSPVYRLLEPVASALLPVILALRYARWFHAYDVYNRLVPTQSDFGYENRWLLYQRLLDEIALANIPINYLEFGVARGASFSWWVEHNTHGDSRFVGFDTFRGIPENWGSLPRGTFSTEGTVPPIRDARCRFECGLFTETLPAFARAFTFSEARTIVHMDADLYSSTLFALVTIAPMLKVGDIVMFDEFADVMNEFRAMLDWVSCFPLKLTVIRAVNWGNKVAFAVERVSQAPA